MTIFNVPCSILTVEFTNDMNMGKEEELDVDRLSRTRLFPNGTSLKGDDIYEHTKNQKNVTRIEEEMLNGLVRGESCNFFGIV